MSSQDERYMRMALKYAAKGLGAVEPNPAVGCLIMKANQIVGKGWHRRFGEPHAEIVALEDCQNIGVKPEGATMYVTLEPCCHEGKTGPCTKAIIEAKVKKVVAATIDPSAHADGKGFDELRAAGIEVEVGVCEKEARVLNAPFIGFAVTGRPWVTLKWAQTIDGKMAWAEKSDERRWISNELSRKDAHGLRRRAQGILVGIDTVLADDPMLIPRPPRGRKPLRIVLDTNLRIPLTCRLLRTAKHHPTLVVAGTETVAGNAEKAERVKSKGAELLCVPTSGGRCALETVVYQLGQRGVTHLLVEGGAQVITSFLKENLADEVCAYIAPKILGARGSTGLSESLSNLAQSLELKQVDVASFNEDVRLRGLTPRAARDIGVEAMPEEIGDVTGA